MKIKIIGNLQKELEKTAKEVFTKELVPIANTILPTAIKKMDAVDTGNLKNNSFVEISFPFIRFWTAIPYAVFVILGLGTNRRYGNRNYLEEGAKALKSKIETGTYNLRTARGSPNKGRKK